VTVNPTASIISPAAVSVCSGTALGYVIASNVSGSTYSWSRPAVAGIFNAAVSGQTSGTINEVLNNATNAPVTVTYTITPFLCRLCRYALQPGGDGEPDARHYRCDIRQGMFEQQLYLQY
jgi:hypothetical protein